MIDSPTKSNTDALKIPFDSLTLRAVVAELRALLLGGQVQDARQPTPEELQLGIRSRGQNFLLTLSCDARFARVHLSRARQPNAPTPPTFCMTLRKHLENGYIQDVRQRGFDRILELEIESRDQAGNVTQPILIAEMMGKHSNLILINDQGVILDSAKRISQRVNRLREILPGLPYQSPPEQTDKRDPFAPNALEPLLAETETSVETLSRRLLDLYAGLSPFLARELALRFEESRRSNASVNAAALWKITGESIFGAAQRGDYSPVLVRNTAGQPLGAYPFPLRQAPPEAQASVSDLNFALDTAYASLRERAGYDAVFGELRGKIEREIKRLDRQREMVERALQEADRAEAHKQAGELILANLRRIQTGDETVIVQDYYAPGLPDRAIPLDPKLSPQENAEASFRRYRKARNGQETALEQGIKLEQTLEALRQAQAELAARTTESAVRELRDELLSRGLLRRHDTETTKSGSGESGPDFQGHKIRRYATPEGYEIYLGETATANDFLTTRLAGPNDLWLHVRAATSAHVVIRTKGKPEQLPSTVLERAALLCAQHSAQKHSSLVSVDYTLRKYVRKPRGAAPGSVDYEREKTLTVTP